MPRLDLPRLVSAVYVGMNAIEIGDMVSDYNKLSALRPGRGGRDRTSEWRNQNRLDYSTISKRIWKKGSKCPLAISVAWPPFPNKEAAVAGRISLAKSEATGCARADREGHGVDSTCEFDQHAVAVPGRGRPGCDR